MGIKEQVLKKCTITGNVIKLPDMELDRKDYLDVKKSFEMIGGKWKGGKIAGFVFSSDPTELLASIIKEKSTNLKKKFNFFATPEILADELVYLADLQPHDTILEPSAGQGAIIKAINKDCACLPDCYELMDTNRTILNATDLRFNLIGHDFFDHIDKEYSKIIANPPFSRNQDITHLKEMYEVLGRGGRLVCLTSTSWEHGGQKKQIAFRAWLDKVDAEILGVDSGAFKESGTMVACNIVIINMPLFKKGS